MRFRSSGWSCLFAIAFCGVIPILSASRLSADSYDWRSVAGQNWMTPVKSQFGGTCWDFSSCGALEAKYKLTRNDPVFNADVSEQHICWETNPDMGGTGGGWGPAVLDYFTSHGVVSDAECPYQESSPDVGIPPYWPLASGWQNRVWKSTYNLNGFTSDTNVMKARLKTDGPMVVSCWAGYDLYYSLADMQANYRGPTWDADHEVVLMGYTDDASIPSGGYWIIKNSWGEYDSEFGLGYSAIPYGNIEIHNDVDAIGAVYYTGSMATATWSGGAGTWTAGDSTKWSGYAWENKETSATFGGTGGTVTLTGSVIAHGITINSGSTGYNFTGGSLTVTSGGITANESTTIASPLYVGGPQSWTVSSGKTLTVNGPLHTVVSDTTIAGAGNVTINGAIDGGGAINSMGAKPGGIIKNNTGSLTLTAASNFGGDITVNTGTLNITPAGGAAATFSGAFFGSGGTTINSTGTTSIGGGASNYSGAIAIQGGGTLQFIPAANVLGTFSGAISGGSPVRQNGPGTTKLTATNSYTGGTTISNGALQANSGAGLPSGSLLTLDGGVLQSNSAVTFTRTLSSTAGSNRFYWNANGGGFSAGGGTMTVQINNGTGTLTWGTTQGSQIVGPLKLSSTTAAALTNFRNGINLNAGARTVRVDDNLNSTADYAQISGVISGTGTSSSLTKSGDGKLYLSATNTYGGTTTVSGGTLQAAIGTGIPTNSLLALDGGVYQSNSTYTFTKTLGAAAGNVEWTANGGGFAAGSGALSVRVNNGTGTLTWGSTVGSNIVGTLMLSSKTATNTTTFQNGINLNGGARTLIVDDNSASTADYAILSGALSGSGGSLTKTGTGKLVINGSSANTFNGLTTIMGGDLDLNKTTGPAIAGDLTFAGNNGFFISLLGNNQLASTTKLTWNCTVGYQELKLLGHNTTVAGINDNTGYGVIENTWGESNANCTMTVNNAADNLFRGYFRDTAVGSGTLALVKTGAGTLTLSGGNISHSGGTTISGGKLVLRDTVNYNGNIVNNSALELSPTFKEMNYSGAISGSGSVSVTGWNKLTISGAAGNTYTGPTNISEVSVDLNKSSGYAIPGVLNFSAPYGAIYVRQMANNQLAPTSVINFNDGYWPHFELLGHALTLAGISDPYGTGVIENTQYETDIGSVGVLTLNNSANYAFAGYMRDGNFGGSTGSLALVKNGAGTLTLSGPNCGGYTGGLTINAGTLDLTNGVLPNCTITINGGTLIYPGGGHSAMAAAGELGSLGLVPDAASDWTESIANNGALVIPSGGTASIGEITGSGSILVSNGATLRAHSIVQDSLTIGGAVPAVQPVPEPSSLVLLASLIAGAAVAMRLRRKR